MVEQALCAMAEYFGTKREYVGRSMKVYGFARAIGLRERLDPQRMEILECAAALHCAGVPESLRKYHSEKAEHVRGIAGDVVMELLAPLGVEQAHIEQIIFLVRNHRSRHVDGSMSLQILTEAVGLVDLDEKTRTPVLLSAREEEQRFRTQTGRELFRSLFGIQPSPPDAPALAAAGSVGD